MKVIIHNLKKKSVLVIHQGYTINMATKTPNWFKEAIDQKPTSYYHQGQHYPIHYLFWPCKQKSQGSLILIHGSFAHAHWYDFIAPLLTDLYDVYAVDLPGMGDSDWQKTYNLKDIAADILDIPKSKNLPLFSIGHSFGGLMSIIQGLYFSEALSGLICVDFSIKPPQERLKWLSQAKGLSDVNHKLYLNKDDLKKRFRLLPHQNCENIYILEHIIEHSICTVNKDHHRITTNNGFYRWKFDPMFYSRVQIDKHKLDHLNEIVCPVHFIFGGRSGLEVPEYQEYLNSLKADLPISIIPHAYHHVFLDQPLAFVSTIRNQLENWRIISF